MQGMTMASPRPLKPQNTMACRISAFHLALPEHHFENAASPLQTHEASGVNQQVKF